LLSPEEVDLAVNQVGLALRQPPNDIAAKGDEHKIFPERGWKLQISS